MSVYLIAELGSTPDGSLGNALRLIEHCAKAGVDAVKLQDHRGEKVKGDPPWQKPGHESRAAYLKRTAYDETGWQLIRATATACGVDLVVSPFSVEAVELLEKVPVDAYKVASGQVTNTAMLQAIAATGKRSILSSGMTTTDELVGAARTLRAGYWALLQCTSEYPCTPERVGLNRVADLARTLDDGRHANSPGAGFRIGLSDHTLGFAASLAAITLGATVIERHVGFHRGMYGTDARHSLTLEELARFVQEVRDLEKMLANPVDKDALVATPEMQAMRAAFLEKP